MDSKLQLKIQKSYMLTVQPFTFNPVQENTYVVYNEKGQCGIIDPGCYFPEEREKLRSEIQKLSLKPVLLLNTHCHLDHVFGNKFVAETWGLEPHFHEKEKPVFDFAPTSGDHVARNALWAGDAHACCTDIKMIIGAGAIRRARLALS